MDKLLLSLKSCLKRKEIVVDNSIFRLHYKVTLCLLLASSIFVTAKQFVGDPIDCIIHKDNQVKSEILDTFCWIHTTFSINEAWHQKVGEEVVYPGVKKTEKGDEKVHHAYYQWVCFTLFFQAILFYIPHYFWKSIECGRIRNLCMNLNLPILDAEAKEKNKKLLATYLAANIKLNSPVYYFGYAVSEFLNLVNVVGQMFLMDKFLNGHFSTYGIDVIRFSEWDGPLRYDPMIRVFPRMTKCIFHLFGPSGDIKKIDTMCILPINIINEKIYILLWFWFVILATLSAAACIYRFVYILFPPIRLWALYSRARLTNKVHLRLVASRCGLSDWLTFYLLSKNMDPINYRDLIAEVAKQLKVRKNSNV